MRNDPYPSFRLDQWTTLRLQLLWAYEKEMMDSGSKGGSNYSFQSVLLVKRGWARAGGSETNALYATKGEWLFLPQGPRWQRFSPDCVVLSIGFRFQLPTGEAIFDEGLPVKVNAVDFPRLEREANRVMHAMRKHIGLGFYLQKEIINMRDFLTAQNALRLFLIEIATAFHAKGVSHRIMSHENPHLLRAFEVIEGGVSSGREVARRIGISLTQLDRLMVAETGYTVHGQLELRRLQLAQDALQANAASLKSIAYDLGFCSPSHFHSWFKKRQGMTPSEYRERAVW